MIPIAVLLMLLPSSEAPALALETARRPDPASLESLAALVAQEAEEEVRGRWTGSLTLGANWAGGNTKNEGVNGTADAEFRRENDRTTVGASYAYQKDRAGDITNEDRYGARAQYDYFFTEKTYGLAQTSYQVDTVASLRSRVTAGVGAGRQFREDDVLKFSGEAGVSWKDEEFPHGQGGDDIVLRVAYNLDWKPNERWEFGQMTTILPVIDDVSDVYLLVDSRIKATISGSLFAQLQYVLAHDETPAAGKDMTDHRALLSVGWSF